jgi:predicted acetyltransferase
MGYQLRYAAPEEFPALADLDSASFGFTYSPEELDDALLDIDRDTMFVAVDDTGQIVAVSAEVPFTMTLPGGETPALGLTWVSVEITHRRRGILRTLMHEQLRAAAARGVPVVILGASEGGIYGRYGFGVGTVSRRTVVDRRAAVLARPVGDHGVIRIGTDAARDVLPGLYDRYRRITPGVVDRNARRWQFQLLDHDWQRRGRSGLFHLVHDDGYVSYRVSTGTDDPVCTLVDYVVCSADAHAGLWQVLLGMDLVARIESTRVPLDDPLPYLLTDPRQVATASLQDGLWVRPLDVAGLLAARTYAVGVDTTLSVRDTLLGDATFRLRGAPDGASCARTDAPAEVELDVAALGAVLLGGTRLAELARARRVHGEAGVLRRLDRALLADVAPQFGTYF